MFQGLVNKLKSSPSFWQTMANYAERIWGFAYSLILARLIMPEEFGVFAFGMGIAQVASILTRWEVGNLIRTDKYYQKEGFDIVWALTKVLAWVEVLILFVVAGALVLNGISKEVWITILVCGIANAVDKFSLLLKSDLEAQSSFKNNFKVKLIFPPVVAAITIPMAWMGYGIWALLSSAWVGVLLNWIVFRRANPRTIYSKKPSIVLFKNVIAPSLWQWMNYICYIIYTRADKVLVGSFESKQSVGYYTRSFNYAPLSFIGLGAIAGVPAIVAFRDLEDERAKWKIFYQRAGFLIGAGILNAIIWLFWAKPVVLFLFGENWLSAVPYFKAFAFFGAVQGIYFLTGSIMQGSRQYKAQALITLMSILGIVIYFCFMPISGIQVAIALQVSMVISAVSMIVFLKSHP